jgi:uncharacterized protein
MEPTSSPYIEVRLSSIHNHGIFAKKGIPKGTKVIQYVGEKILGKEGDRRSELHLERAAKNGAHGAVYVFELNDKFDIDGSPDYNTAKYINHSCSPNCEADIGPEEIWIVAIRDIKQGEELTYNYGYDMEDFEDHPCKCGSKNCVGYILEEEHWPKLQQALKN